jgi:hypothetical protein
MFGWLSWTLVLFFIIKFEKMYQNTSWLNESGGGWGNDPTSSAK